MTIKIEIEVPTELVLKGTGSEYLERAASALGFARGVSSVSQAALTSALGDPDETAQRIAAKVETLEDATADDQKAEAPKRERGKPSQGRARRTKEEIAEDEAADAADAAKQQAAVEADLQDDAKPAISTGEERISPEDEQDAADEAAETDKTGLAPIDVLRRLVGAYQKKHGMPAAVKLCQEGGLIGKPIHDLDDAGIEAAIAAMQDGEAPVQTEAKPAEKVEPKTKADLIEAMMRYADKFDGTREQAKMKFTLTDCPLIFVDTFGPDVQKLSQVPEDGYGKAVAAIEAAIEADPYGRAK